MKRLAIVKTQDAAQRFFSFEIVLSPEQSRDDIRNILDEKGYNDYKIVDISPIYIVRKTIN